VFVDFLKIHIRDGVFFLLLVELVKLFLVGLIWGCEFFSFLKYLVYFGVTIIFFRCLRFWRFLY
ncbi:hypothetical protein NQU36_26540, partial [Escherichia coli]|uniref:hypothetical protein n=1 Tax=Escherichia coli TaxID=562 RepID=UPI00211731FB